MNTFDTIGLSNPIVKILKNLGYESPTPIQAEAIPVFLKGGDLIAQAQTGTGKTAAFALPLIEKIDSKVKKPQALILAPTRELAIQVAEAFKSYAKHLSDFYVLPIYGGQEYRGQLIALKRGVQVVVGTPGRVMDHMRRGTLQLDALKTLVLDEADEMLKMGFIDDIEWILQHVPEQRQIGLFSATMPDAIQKVANKYLRHPTKIQIASKTKTVERIEQNCIFVSQANKLEALTRFLETESFDAVMVFARTKIETIELADKLAARGYSVEALNGDIKQSMREKVIQRLKNKTVDIVVATEVAARGLDVDRIDLVVNYDIPTDPESYVHRIGRTGRAGRAGKAILFVTPREKGLLNMIERTTNARIQLVPVPTLKELHVKRIDNLSKKIVQALTEQNLDLHRELIERVAHNSEYSTLDVAAGLSFLLQGDVVAEQVGHDILAQPVALEKERSRERDRRPSRDRDRGGNRGDRDQGRRRKWSPRGESDEKKRFGRERAPFKKDGFKKDGERPKNRTDNANSTRRIVRKKTDY